MILLVKLYNITSKYIMVLNLFINSKSDKIIVKSYENVEIGWNRLKSRFWTCFTCLKGIYILCTTGSQEQHKKVKNLASSSASLSQSPSSCSVPIQTSNFKIQNKRSLQHLSNLPSSVPSLQFPFLRNLPNSKFHFCTIYLAFHLSNFHLGGKELYLQIATYW